MKRLRLLTIYRVVVLSLVFLVASSLLLSAIGLLTIPFVNLVTSLVVALVVSFAANKLFSRIWRVTPNRESWLISALIIYCIMAPVSSVQHALAVAVASAVAMACKFVIAYHGRHIFNPAAFGATVVSLIGFGSVTWWIGSQVLFVPLLLVAVLIIVRLQLYRAAFGFFAGSIAVTALLVLGETISLQSALSGLLLSSPLLFLGGVMLTEPTTLPAKRLWHVTYGALVGVLFAGQLNILGLYISPAIALLVGNILAFVVNPKQAVSLVLKAKEKISDTVYGFTFTANQPLQFIPGQYMNWTLPVASADNRGNRRTFSFASAPGQTEVRLGIRFSLEQGSAYKKALLALEPGAVVHGSVAAGDFTLPYTKQPIVMIAGGIGITPFISMMERLLRQDDIPPITIFACVRDISEVFGKATLKQAHAKGVIVHVVPATPADTIAACEKLGLYNQPADSLYYVSGAPAMIINFKRSLKTNGIAAKRIKTDSFSGY